MTNAARLLIAALSLALCGCATTGRPPPPATARSEPFLDCRGQRTEAPTVVLESGSFGTSADWGRTLDDLAKGGRACAYDRWGMGLSPFRAEAPTPERIARDLAATLDRIGETRPIILVGHSNGGLYAETFATLFPERLAGVAYVNGVGSDDLDSPLVMSDLRREERVARVAVAFGGVGWAADLVANRMIDDIGLQGEAAERKRRALVSDSLRARSRDEVLQIIPGLKRVRDLGGVPPAVPTVVVTATPVPTPPLAAAWRAAQIKLALRACQGWVLDAVGGSHVSPLGRDRAYLTAAVDWLRSPGLRTDDHCSDPSFKR